MARTQNAQSRERCRELRQQGYSLHRIAEEIGVSLATVRYHAGHILLDADVPVKKRPYVRRGMLPEASEPLPPSEDLAYLIGVLSGDGCLSHTVTCKMVILCDARYPDLIAKYVCLVECVLGRAPKVMSRKNGRYFEICLYGKSLPILLGLPCGVKSASGYTVPEWIFERPEFMRKFVLGLIETDGGVYHEFRHGGWCSRCLFTAFHEPILEAFLRATAALGYNFRRCGNQARLTVTSEVKRLVVELDVTKVRVYKY